MITDYIVARLGLPPITPRAKALIIAGALLLVSGVLTYYWAFIGDPVPDTMMYTGSALIAFTIAYTSFYSIKTSGLARVEARRVVQKPLIEGRPHKVRLILRNPTPLGFEAVEIVDYPPNIWDMRGNHALINIPPLGEAVMEYEVTPVIGKHRFGPPIMVYRDPLGLIHYTRALDIIEEVNVQPRPVTAPKKSFNVVVAQQPSGLAKTRKRGIGSEFLELREYQPGDEIRYIDWKATARTGKLMVKVMEKEVVNKIIVVLDLLPSMFTGIVGETKAEYAVRIATSLSAYLARRGDPYMVIIVNPDATVRKTPWLRGRSSIVLARKFLAETVVWPMYLGWDRMASVMVRPALFIDAFTKMLPRSRTLIIYFSDFNEDKVTARTYAEKLNKVRRLGHDVVAVMPLTIAFEAKQLGELAPLYRLLSIDKIAEYREIRRGFHRMGIPTVVAGPADILQILLQKIESLAR